MQVKELRNRIIQKIDRPVGIGSMTCRYMWGGLPKNSLRIELSYEFILVPKKP